MYTSTYDTRACVCIYVYMYVCGVYDMYITKINECVCVCVCVCDITYVFEVNARYTLYQCCYI